MSESRESRQPAGLAAPSFESKFMSGRQGPSTASIPSMMPSLLMSARQETMPYASYRSGREEKVSPDEKPALSLAHAFATYPPQRHPDIQRLYANRLEFAELKDKGSEKPGPSGFYNVQLLTQRTLRTNTFDRIFDISEPGTGKTRKFIATSEYFRANYLKGDKTIVRAYVIVPNENVANDFRNQLACSAADYREIRSTKVRDKLISEFYTIMTHMTFPKEVYNKEQNALREPKEIFDKFSNTLFFVDEAHRYRKESTATGQGDISMIIQSLSTVFESKKQVERKEPDRAYNALITVFSIASGLKRMIATATPMYNNKDELVRVGNLVLAPQMRLEEGVDYSVEQIKEAFRGYVSYVASSESRAKLEEVGNVLLKVRIPDLGSGRGQIFAPDASLEYQGELKQRPPQVSQRLLSVVPMGAFQRRVYQQDNKDLSQASLLVFQDGSVGGTLDNKKGADSGIGLARYVQRNKNGGFFPTAEFNNWIGNKVDDIKRNDDLFGSYMARIEDFSAIYRNLLPIIRAHVLGKYSPNLEVKAQSLGTMFIFSHSKNGGGHIFLGQLLERILGYQSYRGDHSAFGIGGKEAKRVIVTCDDVVEVDEAEDERLGIISTSRKKKQAQPKATLSLEKARRYAILSSDESDVEFANTLQLMNSDANWNGEYMHVILANPAAGVGINVSHVTVVATVTTDPNDAGTLQAVARVLRLTSHQVLERESMTTSTTVKLFQFAATAGLSPASASFEDHNLRMQRDSLLNAAQIVPRMDTLRTGAFDAYIHSERNFKVVPNFPLGSDISTYQIYYADEAIESVIEYIRSQMRFRFSLDLQSIMRMLPDVPHVVLERALAQIQEQGILDGLFNQVRIHEEADVLLLSQEIIPENVKMSELSKSSNVTAQASSSLSDFVFQEVRDSSKEIIIALNNAPEKVIEKEHNKLSMATKIGVIEQAIEDILMGRPERVTKFQEWLIKYYDLYIHLIPDPHVKERNIVLHRLGYLAYIPKTRKGQASRIDSFEAKYPNRILEIAMSPDTPMSKGITVWRSFEKYDTDIKKLVIADLNSQISRFDRCYAVLTEIEGQYRLNKVEDGKLQKGGGRLLGSTVKAQELYDLVYRLGVPPYDMQKPEIPGYYRLLSEVANEKMITSDNRIIESRTDIANKVRAHIQSGKLSYEAFQNIFSSDPTSARILVNDEALIYYYSVAETNSVTDIRNLARIYMKIRGCELRRETGSILELLDRYRGGGARA